MSKKSSQTKSFSALSCLAAVMLLMGSTAAHADGLTSTGDTLPIGANGQTVVTITGSTKTTQFAGPVGITGLLNAPGGVNVSGGGTVALYPTGDGWFTGNLEVGTEGTGSFMPVNHSEYGPALSIGGATTNNTDPIYFQRFNENYDTTSLRLVIGDNSGSPYTPNGSGLSTSNGDAFVIGALNSADGSYGWVPHFTFTSQGFLGVGTTQPIGTLDVENSTGTASICLNGHCLQSTLLPNFSALYVVSSAYTVGAGTKDVSCPENTIRTSCSFYSNSQDGLSLINTNPVQPIAPRGCELSTPENVDPWAVTAYCAPLQ